MSRNISNCRACGTEMMWVETPNGKKMPLDKKPMKVVIVKEGIGEVVDAYMPHWATCPGADQFRKGKEIEKP